MQLLGIFRWIRIQFHITWIFIILENLGLDEQGLYREVGVASKIANLPLAGLDKKRLEKINLDEPLK